MTFFLDILHQFGVPDSIITNNGTQFTGRRSSNFATSIVLGCMGSHGSPKNERQGQTRQRNDLARVDAEGLRLIRQAHLQAWWLMSSRAPLCSLEPTNYPQLGYQLLPLLHGVRLRVCPPDRHRLRLPTNPGTSRACSGTMLDTCRLALSRPEISFYV